MFLFRYFIFSKFIDSIFYALPVLHNGAFIRSSFAYKGVYNAIYISLAEFLSVLYLTSFILVSTPFVHNRIKSSRYLCCARPLYLITDLSCTPFQKRRRNETMSKQINKQKTEVLKSDNNETLCRNIITILIDVKRKIIFNRK